ncbi:MAG: retention module-containing protein, partial [Aeromonas sp.]|uniref:retention module-containing protein n=1 Tax=Aeromonas sp. TaxID=647 RepID=UPI003D6B87A6
MINAVTLEQGVTVTQLKGQIYLIAADGSRKLLAEGDVLPKGAVIISPDGASFMGGGQSFNVQSASEQIAPAEEGDAPLLAKNNAAGTPDDINALQQAILEGVDPTKNFDASAAGGAPAAGGGDVGGVAGSSGNGGFVSIDRVGGSTISQAGFDTSYDNGIEPTLDATGLAEQTFISANLTLSAQPQVNEGGFITFTAFVDVPVVGTDLVVSLSNGAIITIPTGQTTGSVTVSTPADSPYVDSSTLTVSITGTQGGDFNQIIVGPSTKTQINDTIDTTTVTLSGPAQVNEGAQITYNASVNNAPQTDLVLSLSNGASITIKAGELNGSVTVDAPVDDVYQDGSSLTVSITGSSGGNYEQLDTSSKVTTEVVDTVDTTIVTLSGPASVVEGEQTAAYTVTLSDAAPAGSIVTLSYSYTTASGEDITETVEATVAADGKSATFTIATVDDKFAEGDEKFSVSVSGVKGADGKAVFEKLDLSKATVETTITDSASPINPEVPGVEDTTTVTLSGPASVVEGEQTAAY